MRHRIPFTENDLHRVQDFRCGDLPYQKEVSDWIKAPATAPDSALADMRDRGTAVWLYEADDGAVIGFGSLGLTSWTIPNPETGKKERTPIQIIPNFAIDSRYKRKPDGVPEEQWYSRLVFADLLTAAYERAVSQGFPYWLGLLVFADNARAIELYRGFGFQEVGRTRQNYVRMLTDLSDDGTTTA